jgi:hypothetical protein
MSYPHNDYDFQDTHAFRSPQAPPRNNNQRPAARQQQSQRPTGNQGSYNQAQGQRPGSYNSAGQPHAQGNRAAPQAPQQQNGEQRELPKQMNVYGKKAALQLSESRTRRNEDYTVMIEGAVRSNPSNPSDKTFNWEKKIALQLTLNELPLFIAVLNGYIGAVEFANHGADNTKSLRIALQDKNFFISLSAKDHPVTPVPVSFIDGLLLSHFALNEYLRNYPNLSADAALNTIARVAQEMNQKGLIRIPRQN